MLFRNLVQFCTYMLTHVVIFPSLGNHVLLMYANTVLTVAQVNFLTKLVALKPGKTVQEMIKNVMLGKDEGADTEENRTVGSRGIVGRVSTIMHDPKKKEKEKRDHSTVCFCDILTSCDLEYFQESLTGRKPLPVRPGMFLETVSKVKVTD